MIKYAAKIRDRPLLVAAIEAKIEQIERLLRNAYGIRNLGFAQAIEQQASSQQLVEFGLWQRPDPLCRFGCAQHLVLLAFLLLKDHFYRRDGTVAETRRRL